MLVLNVAEKPSVAKEIAIILSNGQYQRKPGYSQYNAIFEFPYTINGQRVDMAMTSVTGHLMELEFDPRYRSWHSCNPKELFTAPVIKKVRTDETQLKIAKTLTANARKAKWLILWLDCDREGENIAFEVKNVCEKVNSQLQIYRATFSALVPRDIHAAMNHLGRPNERLSLACDVRSEIDLRIGAAFTRFQTMRIQQKFPSIRDVSDTNGTLNVISYGPCQFPTLGFVVERYLKIQNFEKESFFALKVSNTIDKITTEFQWSRGRVYDQLIGLALYEVVLQSPVLAYIIDVQKKNTFKTKPLPLTTVELQKRMSKWCHLSSEETMKCAEALYNRGIISYPRTETNKFKDSMNLQELVSLYSTESSEMCFRTYVTQQLLSNSNGNQYEPPRGGTSDDQAHPPIHPTKSVPFSSLKDNSEKKVYEFVVRHFLACCSRDAMGAETKVKMAICTEEFTAKGLMVTARNYLDIYTYEKWNATSEIPSVYQRGYEFQPTSVNLVAGETNPPPLLSESDLIAKMDSNGIGTDATIAEHIKTILKREYARKVQNNRFFEPTKLGLALVQSYQDMGLELAKPSLRAAMETDCKEIALGRKEAQDVVRSCMSQMQSIFTTVSQNADVLDQTFSEHFNLEPSASTARPQRNDFAQPRPQQMVIDVTGDQFDPTHTNSLHETRSESNSITTTTNIPTCSGHKLSCVERVVTREGRNTGREFYACSLPQAEGQCDYFIWKDEMIDTHEAQNAPLCEGHNELCIKKQVKKDGPNKGRYFYVCSRNQVETCGFFQWKTDETQREHATTINSNPSTGIPKCSGHNITCTKRTCRKPGPHLNREFYVCSKPTTEVCGHFQWSDDISDQTQISNGSNSRNQIKPQCACGKISIERTCRNGQNAGRIFYTCSSQPQDQQCNFFQWKDTS